MFVVLPLLLLPSCRGIPEKQGETGTVRGSCKLHYSVSQFSHVGRFFCQFYLKVYNGVCRCFSLMLKQIFFFVLESTGVR
jgi:hypothetical protein